MGVVAEQNLFILSVSFFPLYKSTTPSVKWDPNAGWHAALLLKCCCTCTCFTSPSLCKQRRGGGRGTDEAPGRRMKKWIFHWCPVEGHGRALHAQDRKSWIAGSWGRNAMVFRFCWHSWTGLLGRMSTDCVSFDCVVCARGMLNQHSQGEIVGTDSDRGDAECLSWRICCQCSLNSMCRTQTKILYNFSTHCDKDIK